MCFHSIGFLVRNVPSSSAAFAILSLPGWDSLPSFIALSFSLFLCSRLSFIFYLSLSFVFFASLRIVVLPSQSEGDDEHLQDSCPTTSADDWDTTTGTHTHTRAACTAVKKHTQPKIEAIGNEVSSGVERAQGCRLNGSNVVLHVTASRANRICFNKADMLTAKISTACRSVLSDR